MTLLQRLPANTSGRDFVTGDIHGCFDRLRALMDSAGFRPERDRLLTPGDLVDRGPDSLAALEWLDKPWFFATRGNHDQMAVNFAKGHNHPFHYERNGGRW
ncbi:MAG: serine/threonine protein phosphatase, partial [Lysobacter sp.]|nr:serine/threonine protein phosphatase [Lysobacter sp.]